MPWIDRVETLQNIIARYIDESQYYIIFDELDEDYRDWADKEASERYTALLIGLFKAVQDIF